MTVAALGWRIARTLRLRVDTSSRSLDVLIFEGNEIFEGSGEDTRGFRLVGSKREGQNEVEEAMGKRSGDQSKRFRGEMERKLVEVFCGERKLYQPVQWSPVQLEMGN